MKSINKALTAILAVCLIFLALPVALGEEAVGMEAESVFDQQACYDAIIDSIQNKKYSTAISKYEENPVLMKDWYDALGYYIYAESMNLMQEGSLESAKTQADTVAEAYGDEFPELEDMPTSAELSLYLQGRIYEEAGQLEEAVACYKEVKGCLDSSNRIVKLLPQINPSVASRFSVVSLKGTKSSLALVWNDSQSAESYSVLCQPVGGGDGVMFTVEQCSATIEGLLPDTEYSILVSTDQSDDWAEYLQVTKKTERADSLLNHRQLVRESLVELWTCTASDKREYNTCSELYRFNKIHAVSAVENSNLLNIFVDKGFSVGNQLYYQQVKLSHSGEIDASFSWMMILRLDGFGTFSYVDQIAMKKKASNSINFFPVNPVLELFYEYNLGQWAETSGTLELYIDGMFVGETKIMLTLE